MIAAAPGLLGPLSSGDRPRSRRSKTPIATDLTLANRYAYSLAASLMVPVTVFRSEAGYGVVTSDEFECDPADVITEFDPYEEE